MATYTISGDLGGSAYAAARVMCQGLTDNTVQVVGAVDANGLYSFAGLPNGTYVISASHPLARFAPVQVTVAGGNVSNLNLTKTVLLTGANTFN